MKIVILNGSPKGENSNTMQYMKYILKHRPGYEYKIFDVGRDIKKIEKDQDRLADIIGEMRSADGIVWAFPLYHLSVPSQLMRLIELISPDGASGAFQDKYAAALTTSIHFYDDLAHNYIRAVSEDLGLRYVDGFSAEMEDLRNPLWRKRLLAYFDHFVDSIEQQAPAERKYAPVHGSINEYAPLGLNAPVSIGSRRIVLITDTADGDVNLSRMVDVFRRSIGGQVDVIDLNQVDMAGGCLGCMRCADDNVCVYKDGLRNVFYENMTSADAIVFAGSIHGRYLSSRWKMFFDRGFVNGHCPIMSGGQYGYIISGPLRQLPDLRRELEARAQLSDNHLAGFVTDEYDDPAEVTALIQRLASEISMGIEKNYQLPHTFLNVGGNLLFRDFIYRMGWFFRADARYYKKHGLFDYPQKKYKVRAQGSVMKVLMSSRRFRKMIYSGSVQHNAREYQQMVDAD
jgi:multimeric flavodoxin WrbA